MEIRFRQVLNRSFWLWLIASIVGIALIFLSGGSLAKNISALIVAAFMVGPLRDWLYNIVVWGIDTLTSLNSTMRNNLRSIFTYRHLSDEGTNKVRNDGIYRIMRSSITAICIILGLLCLVFQQFSTDTVQTVLRTIELTMTGQIKAWRWLIWITVLSGYTYVIVMNARRILNGRRWYPILLVVSMYVKTILTAILLRFSIRLAVAWLLYRTIGIGLIVLSTVVVMWRIRRHTPTAPPTPPTPPTAP